MEPSKPILFSGPMVRAILSGEKTQTRRILKPQPARGTPEVDDSEGVWHIYDGDRPIITQRMKWVAGQRLWVREAWSHTGHGVWKVGDARMSLDGKVVYRADEDTPGCGWFPSIHMPREFSRIALTVTDVRVQRLQDISEEDAKAEGATRRPNCSGFRNAHDGWSMDWSEVGQTSKFAPGGVLTEACVCLQSPRWAFANLWDSINGVGAWDANPWVYALTFRRESRVTAPLSRGEIEPNDLHP